MLTLFVSCLSFVAGYVSGQNDTNKTRREISRKIWNACFSKNEDPSEV